MADREWMYNGWKRHKSTDWSDDGLETKRHASDWSDYKIVQEPEEGAEEIMESAVDRLKNEFWSIYQLQVDNDDERAEADKRAEADRVLENLAKKQFKQMFYQARKEAIKKYFNEIIEKPIKDNEACRKDLTKAQYIEAKLDWCKDGEAWESICSYWCTPEYKEKQLLGRHSRNVSTDVAQNRGGSRNFIRCKNYIAKTYGPEEATSINTYKLMKVGANKYRESRSNTCIENPKAKKRLDNYFDGLKQAYPKDWQQRDLDPKINYSSGGGMPHGRLAIGDGSVRKSEILAVAKHNAVRPSNSLSYQDLLKENKEMKHKFKSVHVVAKHLKALFEQSGLPVPAELDLDDSIMGDEDNADASSPAHQHGRGTPVTGSSHASQQTGATPQSQPPCATPQSQALHATPDHTPAANVSDGEE